MSVNTVASSNVPRKRYEFIRFPFLLQARSFDSNNQSLISCKCDEPNLIAPRISPIPRNNLIFIIVSMDNCPSKGEFNVPKESPFIPQFFSPACKPILSDRKNCRELGRDSVRKTRLGSFLSPKMAIRQESSIHPRSELYRILLLGGLRKGRNHYLGASGSRLSVLWA